VDLHEWKDEADGGGIVVPDLRRTEVSSVSRVVRRSEG
jgi:hypothetical protein